MRGLRGYGLQAPGFGRDSETLFRCPKPEARSLKPTQSFRTVRNVSCPPRCTSRNAVDPDATLDSSRLASAAVLTGRRLTCTITSPRVGPAGAAPLSGSL